jgi:prepilin-type processing-associated H-X9-DG protein
VNGLAWILGNMQVPPDWTDLADITTGKLYSYNPNPGIYKCPADVLPWQGTVRIRSYSMSGQMNSGFLNDANAAQDPNFPCNVKESDIRHPSPSKAFVFIDEAACTIDDGYYALGITLGSVGIFRWNNAVAAWHLNGDNLSFADGHAEHWAWHDSQTMANAAWVGTNLSFSSPPYDMTAPFRSRDMARMVAAYSTTNQ